jgi:hypothetical protein
MLHVGVALATCRTQDRRERAAGVGMIEERVGRGGEVDGGTRQRDGGVVLAATCQRLGAYAAPRDPGLQVVAREGLALVAQALGLAGPIQREERAAEERGRLRGVDAEPVIAEPLVRPAQAALRGCGVSFEELDHSGEQVGLEHALGEAQLLHHASRRSDHAPRRGGASAQRLEEGLTAECHRFDRRSRLGDAQHAHHVKTAAAGTHHRARPPQRGERRARQYAVRATAVAGAARRRQGAVECGLAGADLAEAHERVRVHGVCLRLALGIPDRGERLGGARHRLGRAVQRLRIGQDGQLAGEARVPGAQPIRRAGEPAELGHRGHPRADVAGREQRLAPVERQRGARGIVRIQQVERPPEQRCGARELVALEGPPPRRRERARGTRAERPPDRVDRAELAKVLVRLLQVPADRLLAVAAVRRVPVEPIGQARVQLGTGSLENAAVGGVADEGVMEPQCRLSCEGAGLGFDELAPAERFEPAVEIVARLGREELGDGRPREMATHHRGALEHDALPRLQALEARREQRVDRGRHLEIRERAPGRPPVALAPEHAIVDEHAHELPQVERIALARGEHASGDGGRQRVGADHARREPGRRGGVQPTGVTTSCTSAPVVASAGRASRSSGRAASTTSNGTPALHCTR